MTEIDNALTAIKRAKLFVEGIETRGSRAEVNAAITEIETAARNLNAYKQPVRLAPVVLSDRDAAARRCAGMQVLSQMNGGA